MSEQVNPRLPELFSGPSPFVRQKEFERLIVRQEDTLETTWRIDLEYLEDKNSHDRTDKFYQVSFNGMTFAVQLPLLAPDGTMIRVEVKTSEDGKTASIYDAGFVAEYAHLIQAPDDIALNSTAWAADKAGLSHEGCTVFIDDVPTGQLKVAVVVVGNAVKEIVDRISWELERNPT